MNKIRFIKLSTLLLCLASLNTYGQRKEISKDEFFAAFNKAVEKSQTMPRRIVSKGEVYRDNKLKSLETGTSEFVLSDRRRYIFESKNFDLNKTFSTETIRIGNDEYKKENNGNWIKRIPSPANKPPNNNTSKTVENISKFYLTENAKLDNQTANLYELAVEYKHTRRNASNETKETVSYRKEKRWISRDGFLLKMEMEDEFEELPKNWSRRIWTYEYNPNIKIEAPVINTEQKAANKP